MAKDVHLDGALPVQLRTRLEEVTPGKEARIGDPSFPEISGDVKANVLNAKKTEPRSSAMHVRMKEIIAGPLDFLRNVSGQLDRFGQQLADALGQIFQLQPQLVPVYVGARGHQFPIQRSDDSPGPVVLMMAKIRDMITGSIAREVPGQWLDAEYEDVVKAAKRGDASAKKAKKIAEQGDRLREKIRNKGR